MFVEHTEHTRFCPSTTTKATAWMMGLYQVFSLGDSILDNHILLHPLLVSHLGSCFSNQFLIHINKDTRLSTSEHSRQGSVSDLSYMINRHQSQPVRTGAIASFPNIDALSRGLERVVSML